MGLDFLSKEQERTNLADSRVTNTRTERLIEDEALLPVSVW